MTSRTLQRLGLSCRKSNCRYYRQQCRKRSSQVGESHEEQVNPGCAALALSNRMGGCACEEKKSREGTNSLQREKCAWECRQLSPAFQQVSWPGTERVCGLRSAAALLPFPCAASPCLHDSGAAHDMWSRTIRRSGSSGSLPCVRPDGCPMRSATKIILHRAGR